MKRFFQHWLERARRSLSEAFALDVRTARLLIGLFAAGLAITSATVFLGVFSVRIRGELVRLSQAIVLRQTGFMIDIDSLSADVFPPRLRVFGLSVRHPQEKPFFKVQEANIVPGVTRSLSGRVAFDWLELRRPEVTLTWENGRIKELQRRQASDPEKSDGAPIEIPLELYGALISNGSVTIHVTGRADVTFDGIHLFAAPRAAASAITVDMVVPPAVIVANDRKVALRDIRLGLLTQGGDLIHPKSVKLRSAQFVSNALSVQSAGDLDVSSQTGQGKLFFNLDLGVIHTLIPELPPLNGTVAVSAELEAGGGPERLHIEANGAGIQLDTMPLGSVAAELEATRAGVTLKKVRLNSFGGQIDLKGYLVPFGDLPTLLEAEWRNVELAEVLSGAGLAEVWVTLLSNGKAKLEGRIGKKKLSEALLEGKVHIEVEDFRSRDRSFRLGNYLSILHLQHVNIDATTRLFKDRLEVNDATLVGPPGKMEVEARFYFDQQLGFRINGESDELNLGKLAPIAEIPMTGVGPLIFELGGPYGPPRIDAKVSFEEMSIANIPLGHVDSRVLLADQHTLQFPDAIATFTNTQAEVVGAIDFAAGPALDIRGSINGGEVADLKGLIPLPKVFLEGLAGEVSGSFNLSGLANAPDLNATFTSSGVDFLRQPFDRATGTLQMKHGKLAKVQISSDIGAIGKVRFDLDNTDNDMAFEANIEQASLSELTCLGPLAPHAKGRLNAKGSGRLAAPLSGEAQASIDKLQLFDINQGKLSATLALNEDNVDVVFRAFDDEARGRVAIDFQHTPRFELDLDFLENDWSERLGLSTLSVPLKLITGGRLSLRGDFASLNALQGSFVAKSLSVASDDVVLHSTRTVAARLDKRVITLDEFEWKGRNTDIKLKGTTSLDGDLALALSGTLSGDVVRPFLPKVSVLDAQMPFELKIGGSVSDLDMTGRSRFENARIEFEFLPEAGENFSGTVVMSGQSLLLEDVRGDYGRGQITAHGGMGFSSNGLTNVGFELNLQRVRYLAPGDIPSTLDGRLRIDRQASREWLIAGDLGIQEVRYVRDLSLDTMLPSFKRKATQTRTLDRASEAVTYAIDLSADGNLFIDNNLAKAEMKAALKLVGTNQRPGLLGTVTMKSGQLFFNNVTYDIVAGTIDFVERYQVVPRFDLRLKTNACSANIDVNVAGTVEEPRVDARGRDSSGALTAEDALSCLTLGYRGADSSRTGGNANQNNAGQASLGVLSTVTGLDQKIRRFIPVDQVRLGYGFSLRSGRTTPRISVVKELAGGIRLKLESSLTDNQDQRLNLEIPFARNSNVNFGWSNATEIPNDFGFDLKSHFDF